MHTIEALKNLFAYNRWANRRAVESLKASSAPGAKAVRALSHLVIAEKEWLLRMEKNADSTGFDFWQERALEECEALAEEMGEAYTSLLARLTEGELDSVATYRNSKGVEYSTPYRDILTHVLMHSTYHRGQVAMAVRAEGQTPAYTDYIVFEREKERSGR